jgi:16S rRNA (cytidine1402-2'-O)-methyltransferase
VTRGAGSLYIVSTPIGNLEDMTFRAVRVLREVALVAAEDTRRTLTLFRRYDITTPLTSFFEHNQEQKTPDIVRRLLAGDDVALVSDAGTPGISDPGYPLVRRAIEEGITVVSVPGPSALTAAASVAGLPLHEFLFAGFCSPRAGRRRRRLERLRDLPCTLIFYESAHRLAALLEDAESVFGDRPAAVAVELTKVHETVLRGRLTELRGKFVGERPRGEYTVLIGGAPEVGASAAPAPGGE